MSMNLAFKDGDYIVDFPFQTPTRLSYAVIACDNTVGKLRLIKDHLKSWNWPLEEITWTLGKIKIMLEDENLELIVI